MLANLPNRKLSLIKTLEQKKDYLIDLREIERLKRIDRSENDVFYFMYEYFSDDRNPQNDLNLIPAGTTIEDAPKFHRELCELLDEVSDTDPTARIAWAAPQGHAKNVQLMRQKGKSV